MKEREKICLSCVSKRMGEERQCEKMEWQLDFRAPLFFFLKGNKESFLESEDGKMKICY